MKSHLKVVGIGASAGGLKPILDIISKIGKLLLLLKSKLQKKYDFLTFFSIFGLN
mgnify:CR=1 FL=1